VGLLRLPLCGTQREAIEDRFDRLRVTLGVENRHRDFGFIAIVLVRCASRADDFGMELDGLVLGQLLADQDPDFGTDLGRIHEFDSRAGRREFEESGMGSEESRTDPNRMSNQHALANSAFGTVIDFV